MRSNYRHYRQRRDADPQKRAAYLQKEKKKYAKDKEQGKKKVVANMTERGKRKVRKKCVAVNSSCVLNYNI